MDLHGPPGALLVPEDVFTRRGIAALDLGGVRERVAQGGRVNQLGEQPAADFLQRMAKQLVAAQVGELHAQLAIQVDEEKWRVLGHPGGKNHLDLLVGECPLERPQQLLRAKRLLHHGMRAERK
jgi:hypothetical protein